MNNYEIKNTANIQRMSLMNFMRELGYTPCPRAVAFKSYDAGSSHASIISFHTAVQLHNLQTVDWVMNDQLQYSPAGFEHIIKPINRYQFNVMMANKVVNKVYLVANKRKKTVHVNQHFVKFRDAYYPFSLGILEVAR